MATPTESDKRLLQVIVTLTEDSQGRPPTLAEIAMAIGYPSSSRGNVQRQLTRLRPTYVDWMDGPRSLRVTPSGLALLSIKPLEENIDLPLPEAILCLLASGLTYLTNDIAEGKPLHVPFSQAWQRGVNILTAECLLRDVDPPMHLHAALAWCRRPLGEWPVHFRIPPMWLNEALLDKDDQPTSLCREYALTKCDAELETCQNTMLKVLSEAKKNRAPHAYVAFRQFLIEHPVVTDDELMKCSFDAQIGTLGSYLTDLYERVPTLVVEQGKVLLCGFCGWTLQRSHGRLHCGDDRCRILTGDFIHCVIRELRTAPEHLQRVRRAIRRYVVAPGIYEIKTAQCLDTLGITAELWPGYDAYDIRIVFPDRTVWAVDVKDWRFPHLLASHLTPLECHGNLTWDRALYVIPNQRVQEMPGYLDILRNATSEQAFSILTINDLIEEARRYKEQCHA
ncbi:hypothetical protein ccbrp13_20030 [Ktedonobacteria bacterium brp13]|nr:hypothetical protein ccbrp13_20030 [Ktedonobacteria bacterium brp13]